MGTPRLLSTYLASVVTAALGVGGVAVAQTGTGTPPPAKYYPGTYTPYQSPPPVNPTPTSPAQPASRPQTPTTASGSLAGGSGSGGSNTQAKQQPRPTFAPTGDIRPVAATVPDLNKPEPPKPGGSGFIPAVATTPDLGALPPLPTPLDAKPASPPSVTAERLSIPPVAPPSGSSTGTPAPAVPGPDRLKLPPTDVPATPPVPLPVPTTPAVSSVGVPLSSNVGAKQAPTVTVEYEMPESIGVGQPLAYTLIVRNAGTTGVTNVRVDQELPGGCTLLSSDPPAETTADSRMGWNVGVLDATGEKRIKVTVKPAEEGDLRGRATVTFSSAVEGKVKVTRPRLSVALSAPEVVRVGEKVVFQIKITNTGTGPANTMTLHARLTDGLSHPSGAVIEAPLQNLPAGQTKTLPLEVIAGKSGAQQCTLSVWADTNPVETAKANVTLVEPQLIAKQTGPARCFVKAEPVYQVELSNPGTAATDPLTVWTLLPEGFEFVQASDGATFSNTNRAVVWKMPGLAAGSNKTISVKLRAAGATDGIVRTVAQTGATDGSAVKGKALEVKCETAVKAEGVPALRFEVIDLDDPVEVGKEAVYEIKVTNQGTGPCTNVGLVAELADGTAASGTAGPTNGKAAGNLVTFEPMPQLPVKGEAVFKVRVKGTAAGDTRFKVKLTCDQYKTPVSKEENTRFYKE